MQKLTHMTNPWTHLPNKAPFVLPEDQELVARFNKRHSGKQIEILLDQFPSPYVGNPEASVVLLNLNPAYGIESAQELFLSLYKKIARANFEHTFFEYPFYPLNPRLADVSAAGYRWWSERCLGDLIYESGLSAKEFSKKIFCAEYFPYHSRKYGWNGGVLPSQQYMTTLVEAAVSRGALIIIVWGNRNRNAWFEAIPSLSSVNVITLHSAQNPKISRRNLDKGVFEKIIENLQTRQK